MLNGTTPNESKAPPLPMDEALAGSAKAQIDRVEAETMLRTTAQQLANGAPVKDLDGIISRNAGQVLREGYINPAVLGDIIAAVESAKTAKAQDWQAMPLDEKTRYLRSLGLDPSRFGFDRSMAARGGDYASSGDRASGFGRSSDAYRRELTNDAVTKSLASEGYKPAEISCAINFASTIGVNPRQYAGYFVGASQDTRDAIAEHIKKGTAIIGDKLHKSEDAAAVIGAIKAGKIKPEEAPQAVQTIMKNMKEHGVDPATASPKAVHKYFKEHPKALDEAKKTNAHDVAAQAGKNQADLDAQTRDKIAKASDQQKPASANQIKTMKL